jgi:hypothetical protein
LVLESEIGLTGPDGLRRKLKGFPCVKVLALLLGSPDRRGRGDDLVGPPVPRAHEVYCRLIEPDDGAEGAGDQVKLVPDNQRWRHGVEAQAD